MSSQFWWSVRTEEDLNPEPGPYADEFTFTPPSIPALSSSLEIGIDLQAEFWRATPPLLIYPPEGLQHDGSYFEWAFQTDNADNQSAFAFRVDVLKEATVQPQKLNTGLVPPATSGIYTVEYSSDGGLLVVGHANTSGIQPLSIYDTATWQKDTNFPDRSAAGRSYASLSPDGSLLAWTHQNSPWLTVIDMTTRQPIAAAEALGISIGEEIWYPAWSPDGSKLWVGYPTSASHHGHVVNTSTWAIEHTRPRWNNSSCQAVAWSPDGNLLVTSYSNSGITGIPLYEVLEVNNNYAVQTGWPRLISGGTDRNPRAMQFSPDGTKLAAVFLDTSSLGTNRGAVIDVATKVIEQQLNMEGSTSTWMCAWSPDGTKLITSTAGNVFIWNTANWTQMIGAADQAIWGWGPTLSVRGVAVWHPVIEGRFALMWATTSDADKVTVWDAPGMLSWVPYWWTGESWSVTEVWIASASEQLTIPPAAWEELFV